MQGTFRYAFWRRPFASALFSRHIWPRAAGPLPGLRQYSASSCLGERFSGVDVAEALLDALLQDVYAAHEASTGDTNEGCDVASRHAGCDRRSTADIIRERLLFSGRCLIRFTEGPSGGPILIAQPILDFTDDTAGEKSSP